MSHSASSPRHATLDAWMSREAVPFTLDPLSPEACDAAVDHVVRSLDGSVELLGFGEALHGGEEILQLRNRFFQRLVQAHGYTAIAIESSFPRARLVDAYIAPRSDTDAAATASYDEIQETGFGYGFGRLAANRELVEWMRAYNADSLRGVPLRFYGFDLPVLHAGIASPREVLQLALDYLTSVDDSPSTQERRGRIEKLLGPDSAWESPAAVADPALSIGLSASAAALRVETEDLFSEFRTRRPELLVRSTPERYAEAIHYTTMARQLLNFHATTARKAGYGALLGIRDAQMADNLAYIMSRERGRGRERGCGHGKVLVFAHNSHLQRGQAVLPWATWWPAGAHLRETFGPRYAVIATALAESPDNGIDRSEPGTLEARLATRIDPFASASALLLPTHRGDGLPAVEIAALATRKAGLKNPTYAPLSAASFTHFDWLAMLAIVTSKRDGRPPQEPGQAGAAS